MLPPFKAQEAKPLRSPQSKHLSRPLLISRISEYAINLEPDQTDASKHLGKSSVRFFVASDSKTDACRQFAKAFPEFNLNQPQAYIAFRVKDKKSKKLIQASEKFVEMLDYSISRAQGNHLN